MLTDMFQELWAQVKKERRDKLEAAVEKMLIDDEGRGILVVENQFGVIQFADLNYSVPFGEIRFVRKDVDVEGLGRLVSPPKEGGSGP